MPNQGTINLNNLINLKLNQLNPLLMPEYLFIQNPNVLNENLIYNLNGIENMT